MKFFVVFDTIYCPLIVIWINTKKVKQTCFFRFRLLTNYTSCHRLTEVLLWYVDYSMKKEILPKKMCCIAAYIYIYIYIYTNIYRNIIKHNIRTSMNERTHFFIKIYISHFILEKVDAGCEWEGGVGDGDRLLHIDPSSSDHSSTSFSSWLGLPNRASLGAQSPLSAAGSHFGIFSPTNSNCNWLKLSVSWLYFCLRPTCFRCSSAYLHGCIPWLTARSRVSMLQLVVGTLFTFAPFSRNLMAMDLFLLLKTVSMTLFIERCA